MEKRDSLIFEARSHSLPFKIPQTRSHITPQSNDYAIASLLFNPINTRIALSPFNLTQTAIAHHTQILSRPRSHPFSPSPFPASIRTANDSYSLMHIGKIRGHLANVTDLPEYNGVYEEISPGIS
ncbi:hypothetical protein [Coleofasciculus sp.]|uniref:hypothetical protein n=1 Tax=Coleofasciculus sp. TaxID=3100458 RepID=UPI0039F97032